MGHRFDLNHNKVLLRESNFHILICTSKTTVNKHLSWSRVIFSCKQGVCLSVFCDFFCFGYSIILALVIIEVICLCASHCNWNWRIFFIFIYVLKVFFSKSSLGIQSSIASLKSIELCNICPLRIWFLIPDMVAAGFPAGGVDDD